jgi:hypothetical protein
VTTSRRALVAKNDAVAILISRDNLALFPVHQWREPRYSGAAAREKARAPARDRRAAAATL